MNPNDLKQNMASKMLGPTMTGAGQAIGRAVAPAVQAISGGINNIGRAVGNAFRPQQAKAQTTGYYYDLSQAPASSAGGFTVDGYRPIFGAAGINNDPAPVGHPSTSHVVLGHDSGSNNDPYVQYENTVNSMYPDRPTHWADKASGPDTLITPYSRYSSPGQNGFQDDKNKITQMMMVDDPTVDSYAQGFLGGPTKGTPEAEFATPEQRAAFVQQSAAKYKDQRNKILSQMTQYKRNY